MERGLWISSLAPKGPNLETYSVQLPAIDCWQQGVMTARRFKHTGREYCPQKTGVGFKQNLSWFVQWLVWKEGKREGWDTSLNHFCLMVWLFVCMIQNSWPVDHQLSKIKFNSVSSSGRCSTSFQIKVIKLVLDSQLECNAYTSRSVEGCLKETPYQLRIEKWMVVYLGVKP